MPVEAPAAPASNAPATAGVRPDVPPVHAAPASSARPAPGNGRLPQSRERTAAKEQLKQIGQGIKDGSIDPRGNRIAPQAPASQQGQQAAPLPGSQTAETKRQQANQNPQPPAATETPEAKAARVEQAGKLAQAKRVLVRDGWKVGDFDKFDEADLIARADGRAKSHAETDRIVGEHSRLKSQLPPARAADGTFAEKKVETPPKEGEQSSQSAPQPDARVSAFKAKAEAVLGKPAAELLAEFASSIVSDSAQGAQAGNALAREVLVAQGQQLFASEYPEIATERPEAFEEVEKNATALLQSGRYANGQMGKVWSDAMHMAFGASNKVQQAQREMLGRQTAAQSGSVRTGELRGSVAPATPLSHKDQMKAAALLMKNNPGKSIEQLRALLPS